MKIAIGADHGGYQLKQEIVGLLENRGYRVTDCGTHTAEPCDYPKYAFRVGKAVSSAKADCGILICKSGNGMAIIANKFPNVRAAICGDKGVAVLSRQHNDANVLVLGSEHLLGDPHGIINAWLGSEFEGGRHARRVNQIRRIEEKILSSCRPARAKKEKRKK